MAFSLKIPEDITKKFSQIDEKNRKWIVGGVLLLIFLGDYFLIMKPFQVNNLLSINPKITVLRKDLKQARIDIKRIAQYRRQVRELRQRMKKIGNRILQTEEIPVILEEISLLARKNDVRINQIMPMKDSMEEVLDNKEGTYYSLPILISAKAGYHNLGRFINQLEQDKIFMSITGLDIAGNVDNPRLHTICITIKAFIMDKKEKGK